jgi:hypothetical protein
MRAKIIKLFNKNIILLFFFLTFASYAHFFSNTYKILIRSYEERILRTYGYSCEKYSFGFIQKIKSEFLEDSKVHIINFATQPLFKSFFYELKKDEEQKQLILLNYNNQNLKKIKINIKEYELIYKDKECFFFKKIK